MRRLDRRRQAFDVWPGFVDALTSLIMVMIFVLLIFAVGQAVLSDRLQGNSRALEAANARIGELARSLSLSEDSIRTQGARVQELEMSLGSARDERNRLDTSLDDATRRQALSSAEVASLSELKRQMETEIGVLSGEAEAARSDLTRQVAINAASTAQVESLSRQMEALREQAARLGEALDLADRSRIAKDMKIADLGRELNIALANQVGELERYRSEFFGKLRETLDNRTDIRVVGDRFVVPTDILFESASADLDPGAQSRLSRLVETIRDLNGKIPRNIDWVLRIDGHTDRAPIRTDRFPSNWELSTVRAVAIVKYLVEMGVPSDRLSANGFGQFQPLDKADTPEAYARNRRIELQLTNR